MKPTPHVAAVSDTESPYVHALFKVYLMAAGTGLLYKMQSRLYNTDIGMQSVAMHGKSSQSVFILASMCPLERLELRDTT